MYMSFCRYAQNVVFCSERLFRNDFPAGQDFECDTVRTSCTVYLGNALSKSIAIKAVRENNVYEATVEVGLDKCNKVYIGLPELFPNF